MRAFHTVDHLHRQGHEVHVAAVARSPAELDQAEGLRAHCSDVIVEPVTPWVQNLRTVSRLLTTTPSSMGYFLSARLGRRILHAVQTQNYDFIHVHCSSVAPYVAAVSDVPKLLDFVDMDSQKWLDYAGFRPFPLSLGYALEGRKMAAAEARFARRFDMNTVVTAGELESLQAIAGDVPADWFPNGVDTEAFKPDPDSVADPNTLVFTGRMDYYPNETSMIWFSEQVMPLVQAEFPDAKLIIIGANPSQKLKAMASRPGITVTGTVPQVQPFMRRGQISVAPLKIARGTQNKVIEAMALGLPIIASPLAARGVDAVAGEHLLVADSAEQWRDAIVSLLRSDEKRKALAEAGRARVLARHTWSHAMTEFDRLLDTCLANFQSRHTA